jgi:hypothetical protein
MYACSLLLITYWPEDGLSRPKHVVAKLINYVTQTVCVLTDLPTIIYIKHNGEEKPEDCTAHAPSCQIWPVQLYKNLPHYLINGRNNEKKKYSNIKCVFFFYMNLPGTFLIRSCINVFMYITRYYNVHYPVL